MFLVAFILHWFYSFYSSASKFLIFMCCSMLQAHYLCPNLRKGTKYRVFKLNCGCKGNQCHPKIATPREEIRFEAFSSYCTCFLQAKAFKGEWHKWNIYLLYKELTAVIGINPKRKAQKWLLLHFLHILWRAGHPWCCPSFQQLHWEHQTALCKNWTPVAVQAWLCLESTCQVPLFRDCSTNLHWPKFPDPTENALLLATAKTQFTLAHTYTYLFLHHRKTGKVAFSTERKAKHFSKVSPFQISHSNT